MKKSSTCPEASTALHPRRVLQQTDDRLAVHNLAALDHAQRLIQRRPFHLNMFIRVRRQLGLAQFRRQKQVNELPRIPRRDIMPAQRFDLPRFLALFFL